MNTYISIHAPTRGATIHVFLHCKHIRYFNPRSHEGSDQACSQVRRHMTDFNPRSHEGSDIFFYIHLYCTLQFQSTLPRGERLGRAGTTTPMTNISIHAPTRGATLYQPGTLDGALAISIHAPTRGATMTLPRISKVWNSISIHAPTRGATISARHVGRSSGNFNPRSHEGSDSNFS